MAIRGQSAREGAVAKTAAKARLKTGASRTKRSTPAQYKATAKRQMANVARVVRRNKGGKG